MIDDLRHAFRSLFRQPGFSAVVVVVLGVGIGAVAVMYADAIPVFANVERYSMNLDPESLRSRITERTKGIICTHCWGNPCPMDRITALAQEHGLFVVEDAAHALFAEFGGRYIGAWGDVGSFSFYPAKNLGAYGDAGIVVTDDEAVADRVRLLSNHGRRSATDHSVEGFNERLDGIQAAVLSTKLPRLLRWNDMRREAAGRYNEILRDLDVVTPDEMPYAKHIYHLYVISTQIPGMPIKIQYGTALVLLVLVLSMNVVATVIRSYYRRRREW